MALDLTRTPSVLLVFPDAWLPRRRREWGPLVAAAAHAGLAAVVAGWHALDVRGGRVVARRAMARVPPSSALALAADVALVPDVLLTTWGVDWEHQELAGRIRAASGCLHSESPLLAWLDGKRELELCLRAHEAATGRRVPRPETALSEELVDGVPPGEGALIVKPSRSGKTRGVEIVPHGAVAAMAREAAAGVREPFVAQRLVDGVPLYEGRRWDARVHALATSLTPLRYRVYREGVAKTAGARARPESLSPDEWLNATGFMPDGFPCENVPLTRMLRHVERVHGPLSGFWERVDALVHELFTAMADMARDWPPQPERCFLLPGIDLIVEGAGGGYEVLLLEVNSHPGVAWGGPATSLLGPHFSDLFRDLVAVRRAA